MPKKVEEYIYILCPSRAYLAAVGIMGPIVHPLKVKKSAAVNLLMSGAKVYEYIPHDKKTIELTLGNINKPERYDSLKQNTSQTNANPIFPTVKPGVPTKEEKLEQTNLQDEITPITDEQLTETVLTNEEVAATVEFTYNEDGTVNEADIKWDDYTRNQKRAIRARIIDHNNALRASEL